MNTREISDVRAQIRRDAIMALAENPYEEHPYNDEVLISILPDSDPSHWVPLWEELRERIEWRDALIDGADPGCDDEGRPEDRALVIEDVEHDIAALLDKLAADAPAVPLRRAA